MSNVNENKKDMRNDLLRSSYSRLKKYKNKILNTSPKFKNKRGPSGRNNLSYSIRMRRLKQHHFMNQFWISLG